MLGNPETRRGVRTLVQAMVQFALIALLWSMIDDLHGDAASLRLIALAALGIIGIDELGYVMENGMRAFKLNVSAKGISADADGLGSGGSGDNG